MPVKIEQVVDGGMTFQKTLSLPLGLELSHPPLPYTSWLVREFCSIVGVLLCVMPSARGQ